MRHRIPRYTLLILVTLLLATACARSPEAKKARFLERGDHYFKREQYREAIIEYRNALRIDGLNPRAIQQLGLAHYQLGEFGQAARFLLKAQELSPDQLEVRLKLGTLYVLGKQFKEAQDEAGYVLARDAKNLEALHLSATAAVTPEEVGAAAQRLESNRALLEDSSRLRVALAKLRLRQRNLVVAESILQETVQKDPKSIDVHIALAELYLLKQDRAAAEREFQAAAAVAPAGSPARIRLADHYLLAQQTDEARKVLGEMTVKAPDYLPAWRRLAEIGLVEGKLDDADKALEAVLTKNPQDLEGHFLKGRVFLGRRQPGQAIQEFQQVLRLEPTLTTARYQLALAHLQAGNVQQARIELKEATTVSPNHLEAQLRLARLNLETGAIAPAIEDLTRLIAAQPRLVDGYILLGTAHMKKREPGKALEIFRKLGVAAPKDARGPYLTGVALRALGRRDEARQAFESAIALAPGFVEPVAQIVRLDLATKQPDLAVARVQRQITVVPTSAPLHHLLGNTQEARKNLAAAETAYLQAIELDPGLSAAYRDLARLYGATGRYDEALAKVEGALKVDPGNLGALMLLGTLHERRGDPTKAEVAYAKALEVNPRFAPAANNLAYLLASRDADMERALQLAQTAKEIAPDEPHISDTLGWVLYKRGLYQPALGLFREAAGKLTDNPVVQYHLGLAAYKTGDRAVARPALAAAVSSPVRFADKDHAAKLLTELQ